MKPLAIYIHWPFCLSKCPYCDFNSRVMPEGEDQKTWAQAYQREMEFYAQQLPNCNITSIYFGGGTPSLMEAETVAAVIDKISSCWHMDENVEITIEANPTSSEIDKFKSFKQAGVNRLSLGVQSLDDHALQFLGRTHDSANARRAIDMASAVFDRFSFDLIYARAGQSLQAWEFELDEALSLSPTHLSLYQLTLEEGSVFYKRPDRESLIAEEALAADMFEATQNITEKAGLPAYETSNHAQAGQESRHNMTYWNYGDYIGIGPGAHGRFVDGDDIRWAVANLASPQKWLANTSPEKEAIPHQIAMQEALMMGLRLRQGINMEAWREKFGCELFEALNPEAFAALQKEGFVTTSDQFVATTKKGHLRLNAILEKLF